MEKPVKPILAWRRYILIGTTAFLILFTMAYSRMTCIAMVEKNSILVNAASELKLELTTAHLWLEEILSGDRLEDINNVSRHFEKVRWYATVMLQGGHNREETYFPLNNQSLRSEIEITIKLLEKITDLTEKRYTAISSSGVGSDLDVQYDKLFAEIIDRTDNVKTLLQHTINRDLEKFDLIQKVLMLAIILLGFLGFFIQYRYESGQKRNISQLNKAREQAEESENWLKTTMNSMGDGVIITDYNGRIIYINPVASSLTGWLQKEAKGEEMTKVFNIINEQTKKPIENPVSKVIRQNVVVGLANHTELISKDGKIWPISDSAAPIFDKHYNLVGIVVVFHEISAQRQAEKEKAKLESQLHQTYKMEAIGTLAGGIAHDFNNILAIILGNAEMALDDIEATSPVKYNIQEIQQASNRAKELVKHILSFSRQEESKKEPVYLCKIVEESMKAIGSTIPSSVQQIIELPPQWKNNFTDCRMIMADATQIHQILLNLCINAVQAMEEKGTLKITVEEISIGQEQPEKHHWLLPGEYNRLSVSDTGSGIHPELQKKIFEPFFTTKEVGKGTGMGLAVVHGIVEKHEGSIHVESEPGKGTTFYLYFPLTDAIFHPSHKKNKTPPPGTEHILFVDDDEMVANMGRKLIERLGYRITVTTDSLKALQLIEEDSTQFDLVITDQTMPNLTGYELSEKMLQIRPDLPIILCTGYSSKIDAEKAKKIGINDLATKPILKEELALLIRKVLDKTVR